MKKVLSLLAIAAVAACGGRTADTNLPAGMGGIKVQLHGLTPGGTTMGEIIIQNVFDPSQTILQNCVAKPETLNGMAFCDEMNVLPPGVYEIKVESQTGCKMTQDHYKAVVNAGQTTEVQINLVCDGGNATGGLDVVVTENHYPQIDNITFNFQGGLPGNKFICQNAPQATVATFQVEDAETACANLTAQWSLDGVVVPVGTNPISAVAGPIDTAGVCTFTETINQYAPLGTYNLDIALSDGTLTTNFGYIVHIIDCGLPPPPAAMAAFDPAFRTPVCAGMAQSCDSGQLLISRDDAPGTPEPNAPNTIFGSCADGTSFDVGYQYDESIEALKVSTLDGSPLAAGKTVRIDASLWSYENDNNLLDLWYAADATSPVWQFIGTLTPAPLGANSVSTTFVLPAGGPLQAIRGNFRWPSTSPVLPCTLGQYDDHDDLVFSVQP